MQNVITYQTWNAGTSCLPAISALLCSVRPAKQTNISIIVTRTTFRPDGGVALWIFLLCCPPGG